MKKLNLSLAVLAIIGLVGCGDTDSTNSLDSNSLTSNISSTITGQLVDDYIKNVSYKCGDGTTGITGTNGEFSCTTLPVEFSIGGLQLGSITTLSDDKQIFPQDLVGVDRADTNNSDVLAMAQFLQSCDSDGDVTNGIEIDEQIISKLEFIDEEFDPVKLETYIADLNLTLVSTTDAHEHLESTTHFTDSVHDSSIHPTLQDSYLSINYTLSEDVIEHLRYMDSEERLAFDVYNALYKLYPTLNQFTNIATNGEAPHIEAMNLLIDKYELKEENTTEIIAGVYEIPAIQNLYNALYEKGSQSQQDALEVGCMVEVTDINDLDLAIQSVDMIDAPDVEAGFDFLIQGSYSHYWAFDTGLKNLGISDGCCSLGVIDGVNYCKTTDEYPINEHGSDAEHSDNEDCDNDQNHSEDNNGYDADYYQNHSQDENNDIYHQNGDTETGHKEKR